jgi:hypothetical protein
MEEQARKYFARELAAAIDTLQFGEKQGPWGQQDQPRRMPAKYINIAQQLNHINTTLAAGRALGILPEEFPTLSQAEKSALVRDLRAYHAINANQMVRDRILQTFRERRMSEDLILEICRDADQIMSLAKTE